MRLIHLLVLFAAVPVCARAAEEKIVPQMVLYQPDAVLKERVGAVGPLADYTRDIQKVCLATFTSGEKEGLDVVVMVKPGGRARVWFVSSLTKKPERTKLKGAIEALPAVSVRGPVVFALSYDLNGFVRPAAERGKFQPPIPDEWHEATKAAKEPLLLPDGFVPYVWPEETAKAPPAEPPGEPAGFHVDPKFPDGDAVMAIMRKLYPNTKYIGMSDAVVTGDATHDYVQFFVGRGIEHGFESVYYRDYIFAKKKTEDWSKARVFDTGELGYGPFTGPIELLEAKGWENGIPRPSHR